MQITAKDVTAEPSSERRMQEAVARMQAAPRFLSPQAWDDFASYDGPIVSGDPTDAPRPGLKVQDSE